VGVSGIASSFRPCRPVEFPFADEYSGAAVRVLLVSCSSDTRVAAAMTALERILAERGGFQCRRAHLASVGMEGIADADCAVVFGRGLQISSRWSAHDAGMALEDCINAGEGFQSEVEIASAARGHVLVDGVGPFSACHRFSYYSPFHGDATPLLVRKEGRGGIPVAWAIENNGRTFYTLLGHAEDFRRREFVQLLLNVIDWARQGS
jgi:hypothetical protein